MTDLTDLISVLWHLNLDSSLVNPLLECCSEPRRKQGLVLFNDALNTFYLRLYGVGHMVKDHREKSRCRHMGYS